MKKCCHCGETKEFSDFSRNKLRKDGCCDQCKACSKIFGKQHREKYPEYYREKRERFITNRPHYIWACGSWNMHKRKYIMNMTIKELETKAINTPRCSLCHCPLDYTRGKGYISENTPTLDRVNNDSILTLESTMIICNNCNKSKSNRTLKEFVEYCQNIVKKFKNTPVLQIEQDRIRDIILGMRSKK